MSVNALTHGFQQGAHELAAAARSFRAAHNVVAEVVGKTRFLGRPKVEVVPQHDAATRLRLVNEGMESLRRGNDIITNLPKDVPRHLSLNQTPMSVSLDEWITSHLANSETAVAGWNRLGDVPTGDAKRLAAIPATVSHDLRLLANRSISGEHDLGYARFDGSL